MSLRICFEKKRILLAGVCILLTVFGSLRVPDVPIKFALAACVLLAAAASLRLELRGWAAALAMGCFASASALITVVLCQFVNELRGRPKEVYYFALGCLCFLFAAVMLQLLMLCFSRVSIRPAVLVVSALLLVLAVANRFTYEYRGVALTPSDLLGLRTAFHIAGKYRLYIDKNIWYAIVFFLAEVFVASSIHVESFPRISVRRITSLILTLVLGISAWAATKSITPLYWGNGGAIHYGFVVNFTRELQNSFVFRPKGYSAEQIKALEKEYTANDTGASAVPGGMPHVIVVMNESLADFRIFGKLETDEPVTPFLDSLQENTLRGYALSSVYGGKTPNSEYEFLTGNSMAFISPSTIAFSLIQSPCYSLERYLENLGYESYATHPELATTWRRQQVYPLLGFADSHFVDAYPDAERINGWIKDEAVYDHLIQAFENADRDAPLFLYAVTAQNHGPYRPEYDGAVVDEGLPLLEISGYESEAVGAYLARIHESDRAFGEFVEYFEKVEEPVVILLYGDHHPNEEPKMIRYLYGKDLETLDERQLMYEIPYFIWANFDIEEQRPELTSINYLSTHLLEAAGLPLSPYNRFLKEIEQTIPAINAYGYYSPSEGRFLPVTEAEGAEKQALLDYETLQYNAVYDRKGRSAFFFPIDN